MPSLSLGATLITGKTVSAALRDQMTGRRIRLAAGFVLFTYIAGHLTMHALGNVSWQTMEAATHVHNFVWHSKIGTTLLYGSFAFHFGLALWALYDRRSFRMGSGEWMRLLLGFSILPLLLHHWAAGRYVYSAYDISRTYDVVLTVYFGFVPWWGWRQIAVLLIVWTHGCLGIHFWLRSRPFYHRYQAVLLTAAVLLPSFGAFGNLAGCSRSVGLWPRKPRMVAGSRSQWPSPRPSHRWTELEFGSSALLDLRFAGGVRYCRTRCSAPDPKAKGLDWNKLPIWATR